jgi:cell division protease FtsH
MNPNNRKPSSFFNYLFPYLMMATAVLAFVWLVFLSNPTTPKNIPAADLANILKNYEIKEVTTTERETVTTITGNYIEKNEVVYFTATFETSNTFIKDSVDEALSGRLIDKNDPSKGFYFAQLIDEVPIWTVNNAFETTWFDAWGPTIFVVGGSALVFLFIFSRMNSSVNNTNNKALEFNRSRARREDNSKVKFADVAGAEEEKAELVELVEYLKTPAKFTRLGAKLPRGVLLVGPPGTGKTLLAKAVAGEAGVPFFSISGSDFVEMFVGVGAGRVRDMFRQAKRNAPCLIFIDEIDAVGRQRGAGMGGGNDEREQTLNQLLVELDGFADNSGIIVIAATNRDDVLDPALLRAGRFDRQITVNLPDRKGRAAIFAVHSRNKKIDSSIDFDNISKRTVGFSGADIANIMNEAAILAVRSNRELVTIKDIDEAIDRRIAGPAKSSKGMSEHEREVVAYHEAGHAVIGLNLKFSDKVQKITIVPRGRTGGHVMMTPEEDRFLMTKNQLEARIIGYLGGRTSEEIFFGDVSTGAQNDIEVATRIARMMVTEYGMSSLGPIQYESNSGSVFLGRDYNSTQKNFSTQVAFEIDKEVRKIIDNAHEEAKKLLTEKKQDVILIAKTLLEKETITAEEIQGILSSRPVADEIKKPKKKKEDKDA